MATRPVRFCGVCGGRVNSNSRTYADPIAYCWAHSDVPALDVIPADPLTSLPSMRELHDATHARVVAGQSLDDAMADAYAELTGQGGDVEHDPSSTRERGR